MRLYYFLQLEKAGRYANQKDYIFLLASSPPSLLAFVTGKKERITMKQAMKYIGAMV